jgi:hypothetical protein
MEMAKKKKARRPQPRQQSVQTKESNFWKITAIIAIILLAGVTAKTMFPGGQSTTTITPIQATSAQPIPIQPITGQCDLITANPHPADNGPVAGCPGGNVHSNKLDRGPSSSGGPELQVRLRGLWRAASG